jgi:hypothetical protein
MNRSKYPYPRKGPEAQTFKRIEDGLHGEQLIENVTLPSGLHRAHVTCTSADPKIENWDYLMPVETLVPGAWAYTDKKGLHHLVMTWKEATEA